MRACREIFPDWAMHAPPHAVFESVGKITLDIPTQGVLVMYVDGDPADPHAFAIGQPERADVIDALRNMADALEEGADVAGTRDAPNTPCLLYTSPSPRDS